MHITITFGALSSSLREQCREQGCTLSNSGMLQRLANSIVHLKVHGMLSDAQARSAERRLLKRILNHAEPRAARGGSEQHG